MRKTISIMAISAVMFSGCVSGKWVHPTKEPKQQKRDLKECEIEGWKSDPHSGNAIADGFHIRRIIDLCLELRDYEFKKTDRDGNII